MRGRLLTSMVVVTTIAVVVFGVPLGVAAARLYRGREVARLQQQATRAAGALPAAGLASGDPIELPVAPPGIHLALYDAGGHRVAGRGPAVGQTEVRAALRGGVSNDHDGRWLSAAVPLHDEEQVVGAARAATSWATVTRATYVTWAIMAALGGAAIAVAGALARLQASRLAAPVHQLTTMALSLGNGEFAARIEPSGILELDQASDALNRTAARLGDLVGRARAFSADVSHQLNTPLTSLRLGLESALLSPEVDLTDAVEAAIVEVDRLHRTIETLLALTHEVARPDARCRAQDVIAEVGDAWRGDLAVDGRPLRIDVQPGLPLVRIPAGVLHEILAVLVSNAKTHGAGAITIAARSAGSGVVIDVADEGLGFEDHLGLLDQTPEPGATHGIGLPLARSLAEAHECRLRVTRSGPDPVFSLALPAAASEPQ